MQDDSRRAKNRDAAARYRAKQRNIKRKLIEENLALKERISALERSNSELLEIVIKYTRVNE